MADKKISQLPLATTPLSGGETLPVVQTGATVQVSVNNLTAGRSVSVSSIANGLGAVGTPSYTFTGDTNTGMWSPAADTIAFSEGGSERMRIDSSGRVGIGLTNPSQLLEVAGAGSPTLQVTSTNALTPGIRLNRAGGSGWGVQIVNTNPDFAIRKLNSDGSVAADAVYIDSGGDVGIGTTSPNAAARLDVSSTTSGFLPPRMTEAQRDAITSPPNGLMLYNTTTDKLQVRAAGSWVDLH